MQLSSEFVDSLCVTRVWQAPVSDYIYHAGRHVKMEEEVVQVCFVDKGVGVGKYQKANKFKIWFACVPMNLCWISYQIQY